MEAAVEVGLGNRVQLRRGEERRVLAVLGEEHVRGLL